MVLIIWHIAPVVVAGLARLGELAAGLAAIAGVLDNSDIMESLDHDKSSSILQLIKGKLRDHQKLLKYFNETTTSA